MISQLHLDILHRAGWNEDRCVDTLEWERQLLNAGYPPISPIIREFMQNFAGLRIYPFNRPRLCSLYFIDPSTSPYWQGVLEDMNEIVNEPVFPVGEGRSGAYLMITSNGTLYANDDDYISRYIPECSNALGIMSSYLSNSAEDITPLVISPCVDTGGNSAKENDPQTERDDLPYLQTDELLATKSEWWVMSAATPNIHLRRRHPKE